MTLQQALYRMVRDSIHPAKKIAAEAEVSYGYLMKAADEMQPEFHLQARLIAPLTKAAETDVLIQQIANEAGGFFVRTRPHDSNDAHTAKTLKEVSEYIGRIADSSANGFSHAEVAAIEVEGNEVIISILAHLAKLKAEAK